MNRINVTNWEIPELQLYDRLSEPQLLHYYEPDLGLFIAESPNVIERALNAGYEPISVLMEERHLTDSASRLLPRLGDIPVYTADPATMNRLTGFSQEKLSLTRGMLCAMRRKPLPTLTELLKPETEPVGKTAGSVLPEPETDPAGKTAGSVLLEPETDPAGKTAGSVPPEPKVDPKVRRLVVLENVVNPTNVGAIFRSAAALGMDAILLTAGCSDPLYRRAVRVSMGTVFQIPWTILPSAEDWPGPAMSELHEQGFHIVAMALRDDSVSIDDPKLTEKEKLAVVLGTEGDGLAADTMAACDDTIKIPMYHGVDSLNVAAASAVAFWQLGHKPGAEPG